MNKKVKSVIKLINRIQSEFVFRRFENKINHGTKERHDRLLHWAEDSAKNAAVLESPERYEQSSDPVVRQGYRLAGDVRRSFAGRSRHLKSLRVLVHIPSAKISPGGYSLFSNLVQSLDFIGIPVIRFEWDESINSILKDFQPTIFISSDAEQYISRIDWNALLDYKKTNPLKIGLTASLEEYGNTPLAGRLTWAREKRIDFYYSFRSPKYLRERKEYQPFFDSGYKIISVEFGANPLLYYPVPSMERDIDFVFLASTNNDKRERYYKYLTRIFIERSGFIDGPGWRHAANWSAPPTHRFLYARSRVGINLHINDSIDWPSELNERTYILAACGVPQLVDAAKLLPHRFSKDSLFVAHSPEEYYILFNQILRDTEGASQKALQAQKEVFERHTTFHRAEQFASELMKILNL